MSVKTILTWLLAIVLAGTISVLVYESVRVDMPDERMKQSDDAMMKSDDDSMMKSQDAMTSSDGMMKSEDGMMKSSDAMMKDDAEAMMKSEDLMMKVAYSAYHDGVIGNGQTSVLFFHAKWCPNCRQADADLQAIFGAGTASLPVYKVDYDTETALKAKYGVTYQHTFVVIDGKGNAVKTVLGPSKTDLAALVK